ncbi:MAG TPA: PAS domain-containing protein, partial [Desulfosarcina sp.]|nr:PAS domain-containing protein [Desulfosarcina sp.]
MTHEAPQSGNASPDRLRRTIDRLTRRIEDLEKNHRDHLRRQTEMQSRLSDALRLLRASTTGLITLDKSGLIDGVNPSAVEMLGTDSAYPLKKPISLFIAPEDQSVFFINRSRIVAGTQKEPFEIKLKRRDGSLWSGRI